MDQDEEHSIMKDAPILKSIPKVDPFGAPDGFFDQFPHKVQAAAMGRGHARSWDLWFAWLRSPVFVSAMGLVLVALLAWWVWPNPATDQLVQIQISSTDLVVLDELDESQLYALLEDTSPPMAVIDLPVDANALIDYLETQDLTLYQLTEDL